MRLSAHGGVALHSWIQHRFYNIKVHRGLAQNAHILTCMLRVWATPRLAMNPYPHIWDGFYVSSVSPGSQFNRRRNFFWAWPNYEYANFSGIDCGSGFQPRLTESGSIIAAKSPSHPAVTHNPQRVTPNPNSPIKSFQSEIWNPKSAIEGPATRNQN